MAGTHTDHDVLTFLGNGFVLFLGIKDVCAERVAPVFNVPCATVVGDGRRDQDVLKEETEEWIQHPRTHEFFFHPKTRTSFLESEYCFYLNTLKFAM